jgi:hypothetical protein
VPSGAHKAQLGYALELLASHAQEVRRIYVLGGASAVEADVADLLAGACISG